MLCRLQLVKKIALRSDVSIDLQCEHKQECKKIDEIKNYDILLGVNGKFLGKIAPMSPTFTVFRAIPILSKIIIQIDCPFCHFWRN
ncbi:hypothetical protein D7322_16015 [Sphingobacterium puteale]|uniref:Uncharacterized protein n=1 Tax=Sphingobacterium puteale TaxID=2420510 RepID=A0A420VWL9_9SPHI|nr:hypothetical protein D7322_16015 [Sphingobacterium puteale]